MSLFLFTDYKKYLDEVIEKSPVRGAKAALADAAGCQRSFLSQVLNGSVHLTLDHAMGIAEYLHLTPKEVDYFYSLVGLARSGTPGLRAYYKSKMRESKQESNNLSKRLETVNSEAGVAEYYSSWKFAAVHILCGIPGFSTTSRIATKLNLSLFEVDYTLERLSFMKLIKKKSGQWTLTKKRIHLPRDHFMTFTNHRNWRTRTLDEAEKNPELGVTYSAVYSMGRDDFEKLKEMTIDFLKDSRDLVKESGKEELVSFSMDCVLYNS